MRSGVLFTPQAREDLREILLDVADDSPAAAYRLRAEFQDRLGTLASAPGIGHFREDLLGRRYRFWNFYSYVVVYAWERRPIQIVAVVHGARDLKAFLGRRTGLDD